VTFGTGNSSELEFRPRTPGNCQFPPGEYAKCEERPNSSLKLLSIFPARFAAPKFRPRALKHLLFVNSDTLRVPLPVFKVLATAGRMFPNVTSQFAQTDQAHRRPGDVNYVPTRYDSKAGALRLSRRHVLLLLQVLRVRRDTFRHELRNAARYDRFGWQQKTQNRTGSKLYRAFYKVRSNLHPKLLGQNHQTKTNMCCC
jgi:hypothetical protein